ncbi:MAG TPA: hypothetical protein VFY84_12680 [Jiangellales bacterium]|nr:hypothetical protein [Jiangellales bacterium]
MTDRVEPREHPQVCWIRHEDHRCVGIIQPGDTTHGGDHVCCCGATWPSPVPRTTGTDKID